MRDLDPSARMLATAICAALITLVLCVAAAAPALVVALSR